MAVERRRRNAKAAARDKRRIEGFAEQERPVRLGRNVERGWLDQPYARYLTMRSFCPGRSPQITVVRAKSARASVETSTRPGTSIS